VDYFDIPQKGRFAEQRKVYVVAARQSDVQEYVKILSLAKLPLQAIEVPELGINNIASRLPEDQDGVAVLYMPPDNQPAFIQISQNQEIYISRRIPFREEGEAFSMVSPWESLAEEVRRALEYYQNAFQRPVPGALYYVSPVSMKQNLLPILVSHLNVRVKPLLLETFLTVEATFDPDALAFYLPALGAALRPMGEVK
ncbi:MAG: hypothetical protein HQL93_04870, partial [Magnetococcales bacterium]|nr:hypothetical protein [Magnetococcales bacterium]